MRPSLKITETREYTRAIEFIDLKKQQVLLRSRIDLAIKRVLDHGQYIMGPEVAELEAQLSDFCNVKHTISCANGTDALVLALMALGIGQGDAVFVPTFTFAATAEVVALVGATPVFIDIKRDTFNIDPESLVQGITRAAHLGLKAKAIIAVDLFGQPAEYEILESIATSHGLKLIADGAQSFGATYQGQRVGSIGDIATTSFFPAKPLGCYGDGGAVFVEDDDLADIMSSLRVHGQGTDKYDNVRIGMNGRLDTLQAAILMEKLKVFEAEIAARQHAARTYSQQLQDIVITPRLHPDCTSVWAQYTIILPENVDRAKLMLQLKDRGIPTVVYYVKPLHLQKAYHRYPTATGEALPIAEHLAKRVLSLPMHGYMDQETQDYIIGHIHELL